MYHTVPRRYKSATLQAKTTAQSELLRKLTETRDDLIVIGDIGTGKTHMVCAYVNALASKDEFAAKYITEYRFAELFTLRHSSDPQTALEANREISRCKTFPVLVIDEVGKRMLTENQRVELDELIAHRYDNLGRTIIVSNLPANKIKERIGDRAYDRLKGNGAKVIALIGESLRAGRKSA